MTESADNLVGGADNPDFANAAAALAAQESPPEASEPLDGPVDLPGGFRRYSGLSEPLEVRTAWVRELNGEDEERAAKARLKNSLSGFVTALLQGGVEKLGDEDPTTDDLNGLLIGDRDFLLLEISRATYGDKIEYEDYGCYHCGGHLSFDVSKSEDIEVVKLKSLEDQRFQIDLRKDRVATVTLPTGVEQTAIEKGSNAAEITSILLSKCLLEIREKDGSVTVVQEHPEIVRKGLGVADRLKIVEELAKRQPGPQYNKVSLTHEECGNEIKVSVTIVDLFRGM